MANKLINEIDCLSREDLEEIYNLFWKDGQLWSSEDLKQHLLRYTLMFWRMRSFKASMKDRSKHIINEIHKRYKKES